MKPLKVKREEFPMSGAVAEGMIPMHPHIDQYEIFYNRDIEYVKRGERSFRYR